MRFQEYWKRFENGFLRPQVIFFTRQMADFMAAGVPVLTALDLLEAQTRHQRMRTIIADLKSAIADGQSCSQSFRCHPDCFSSFYVCMVQAGEMTGSLNESFGHLADYLEHEEEVRAQIGTALLYPGLTLAVGVLTVCVLLVTVVPRLAEIFYDFQQTLPWPTLVLMAISKILTNFWWAILALIGLTVFLIKQWLTKDGNRFWWDQMIFKIPLLGIFLRDVILAKYIRTLAILAEHGVGIVTGLQVVSPLSPNRLIQKEFTSMTEQAANGRSLAQLIYQSGLFPDGAGQMLIPSYESGQLYVGLQRMAMFLEKKTQRFMKNFLALLEPLLILVVGGIVAMIAMALLLPLWQINMIMH